MQENKRITDNLPVQEAQKADERIPVNEAGKAEEIQRIEEHVTSPKTEKNPSHFSGIGLAAAAIVSFVAIGSGIIPGVITESTASINAEIKEVYVSDVAAGYYMVTDKVPEELAVVLYNAFYRSANEVSEEHSEGVFENLQPDTVYTMAVVKGKGDGERTITKRYIKTKSAGEEEEEDYMPIQGVILDLLSEHSFVENCLNLFLDVTDPDQTLSNFNLSVVGSGEMEVMNMQLDDSVSIWFSIDISELAGGEYTFTVTAISSHPSNAGEMISFIKKIWI